MAAAPNHRNVHVFSSNSVKGRQQISVWLANPCGVAVAVAGRRRSVNAADTVVVVVIPLALVATAAIEC
jgi:hypothetical protein